MIYPEALAAGFLTRGQAFAAEPMDADPNSFPRFHLLRWWR